MNGDFTPIVHVISIQVSDEERSAGTFKRGGQVFTILDNGEGEEEDQL